MQKFNAALFARRFLFLGSLDIIIRLTMQSNTTFAPQSNFIDSLPELRPAFFVREIPVYGDLILSPMDGFSDLPFRLICRELGSAMSYTEFVNVDELVKRRANASSRTQSIRRAMRDDALPSDVVAHKLMFDPSERPMTFQIYGHNVEHLIEAAKRIEARGPDIIDLNMGCYVKDIAERGAGSGMLRYRERTARVLMRGHGTARACYWKNSLGVG